MNEFFHWLFQPHKKAASWFEIIGWWEIRRIPYNIIVGMVGIASLLLGFLFFHLSNELDPGKDAVEPFAILLAPVFINICYTAG